MTDDDGGNPLDKAERDLRDAEQKLNKGLADLGRAESEIAEANLEIEKAEEEVEEAKHHEPKLVEITVDRIEKKVEARTYNVAAFKTLVGVAADRELDQIVNGTFVPLDDAGTVKVEKHDAFVSHARTGGSS